MKRGMKRGMKRALTGAAVVATMLFAALGFARADENPDPRVRIAVTRVTPSDGVTVTITQPSIAHLSPLLTLRNTTGRTLELHDPDGRPFLRIGPDGAQGNVRSPFYGPAVRPNAPPPPSPGGPDPLWIEHAGGDTVRWYDRRASYDGHGPDNRDEFATLQLFTIPGRLGDESFAIEGAVTWQPIRGRVEATIAAIAPEIDGVTARTLPGPIPAIELRNTSPRTIEITGRDGKPFARIGPDGVTVNEHSPTWADTRSDHEQDNTEPLWKPQASRVLIWLERRAAYEQDVPERVQSSGRATDLGSWTVPGTVDGQPFEIRGTTRWVPVATAVRPANETPAWRGPVAAGAAAVLAGGAVWFVMRRRRDTAA